MADLLRFFELPYNWYFFGCVFFLLLGQFYFSRQKEKIAVSALFVCAFLVRLFMSLQDPFLHDWDERFHALVARNMIADPFTPMLIKYPITGHLSMDWGSSHIWLHKQPLALWQMALSMKLFGVSLWACRLPSVIMGAIMAPMLYRITLILTNKKITAWIAAVIFSFSSFQLEQISGAMGMDHNDVAFGFYVLSSIWAYSEYEKSNSRIYVFLIGLFAGFAVLTKWLVGLLVYSGWAVKAIAEKDSAKRKREIANIAVSSLSAILIFLPWQLYINSRFPIEARIEQNLNLRHLTEVIEGHSGTNLFYLDHFPNYFGEIGWLFVPAGFALMLFYIKTNRLNSKGLGVLLVSCFVVTFFFFSYIATTKVIGYFFVVAPIGIIFLSLAIVETKRQLVAVMPLKALNTFSLLLLIAVIISILNPEKLQRVHSPDNTDRINRSENALLYKDLKNYIPPNVKIVLNTNEYENFQAMFYDNTLSAYSGIVDDKIIDSLNANNIPYSAFESHENYQLPEKVTNSPSVFIIRKKLKPIIKY